MVSRTGIDRVRMLALWFIACCDIYFTTDGDAMSKRSVREQISAAWAIYRRALLQGDVETLIDLFTEDALLMEPDVEDLVGREAIGRFIRQVLPDMHVTAMRNETIELDIYKRVAYELGHYEQTLRPAKNRILVYPGRYFAVWRRQPDDRWKLHRLLLNLSARTQL